MIYGTLRLMRPMHAQQILFGVVVEIQLALVGMMQRFTYPPGQMHIGGGHQCRAFFFFLSHDALERMFLLFVLFMVAHQVHDFLAMGAEEFTLHGQEAGGVMVVDAMAGRALQTMCIRRRLQPLPAPFMKYCAALRTDGRLQRFALGFIGIMHAFLEKTVMPGNLAEIWGDALSSHGKSLLSG